VRSSPQGKSADFSRKLGSAQVGAALQPCFKVILAAMTDMFVPGMSAQDWMDRDPARQFEWHEAHRDLTKNMYRTSYTDMIAGREIHVKSDFPSGYGGHIPALRHDVLFRNTGFHRTQTVNQMAPTRDSYPSFDDHIKGIPTVTELPRGARKPPTFKAFPHEAPLKTNVAPWGLTQSNRKFLCYRTVPPSMSMSRSRSTPALQNRANEAAQSAGSLLFPGGTNGQLGASPGGRRQRGDEYAMDDPSSGSYTGSERLRRNVDRANEKAQDERMPSEAEILAAQMGAM